MEIHVLGRFAVYRDGVEVDPRAFGGRLSRTLTKVLVAMRGQSVSREQLAEMLWPRTPPADPDANLKALVHRSRRALGAPNLLQTTTAGYCFAAGDECSVDGEVFLDAVGVARAELAQDRPGEALRRIERALAHWAEPLPDDAYADWARPYRDGLVQAFGRALETGAEAALLLGDAARAVELAERAVAQGPLDEPAHQLLARARLARGDRAGALEVLDALRARLVDELGVDPAPQTQDLRLQVLRDEVPLVPRSAGRAGEPRNAVLSFVGRGEELARLTEIVRRPGGGAAVVAGRAGSGKSRLLTELASRAGVPTLSARAYLAERDNPWCLARGLLRAAAQRAPDVHHVIPERARPVLSDLVPELLHGRLDDTARLAPETRRALTMEAGLRLLAAATAGGALVLVDDLQWADASSLQLLGSAVQRLDGVAVVLAYRLEEVGPEAAVSSLLSDLQSIVVPTVTLGGLTAEAVADLVSDPELANVLTTDTDGSPFALAEVIRTLDDEGLVERGVAGSWRIRSDIAVDRARQLTREGQRRSIVARLERQGSRSRGVLACLALLGREAPAGLLAAATGRMEPDVLEDLSALARADLVRAGERGWAPAHDLIGETVARQLDAAERATSHAQLAAALGEQPATPGEHATHLLGAGDAAAAARSLAADAHEQLGRHAGREAARLADAGLSLDPPPPLRADLLEVRAEAHARAGELDLARQDLRDAVALGSSPGRRAIRLARLAALCSGADDLPRASELAELALVDAGDDAAARARALSVASVIDMNLERDERATARSAEALQLFRSIGDGHGVADILDAQAMAVFLGGQIRAGIDQFGRVADLYADLGDLLRVVTPRSTRGHALLFAGQAEAGLADTDRALELALDLGSQEGETYARWHRSEVLTACGRSDEALEEAERALAVAERIGHRGWTATALRAIGIAHQAADGPAKAEDAFRRSLALSDQLPLFACWAHARLALVLIEQDRLEDADRQVTAAVARGPELGQYEARYARARLAHARGAPDAGRIVAAAIEAARRGGHEISARQLAALLAPTP